MEMQLPRPLYYFVITITTQFVLLAGAIIALLSTGLLGNFPWNTMAFLLIYNVIIATLAALFLTNTSPQNKTPVLKGDGLVLGHLVGLAMGAFIGSRYGGTATAILGAVLGYFVVGWLGSRISFAMGLELDRLTAAPKETRAQRLIRSAAERKTGSWLIYGAVIPALFLIAAIFLKSSGLVIAQYPDLLPTARLLLIVLSVLSIVVPWLRRSHRALRPGTHRHLSGWALFLAGLGLALAPAACGFLLFVAFGMSIAELSLFAVVASIAMTTWATSRAKS